MSTGMVSRRIVLDPLGTMPDWLFVIVSSETAVIYEQQYGGTACLSGEIEGYVNPVYPAALADLHEVFVGKLRGAGTSRKNFSWPPGVRERLDGIVESIEYWPPTQEPSTQLKTESTVQLRIDDTRELNEAWIPVSTPDGPGVLVWTNSD